MKIQEVCDLLNLTKKAIYYYEKQGLIVVRKDNNGYRIFDEGNVKRLHEISLYRKLDIDIKDIKLLLREQEDKKVILKRIFMEKKQECQIRENLLDHLEKLIESEDIAFQELDKQVDYLSIAQAIQEHIPGLYGEMFIRQFIPYLQITIQTHEQEEAYKKIVSFWDNIDLKIPLLIRLFYYYNRKYQQVYIDAWKKIDEDKKQLLDDEQAYEKTKDIMENAYQLSKTLKYRLMSYPQRKMKIRMQNIGYNDIFIPAMCELSPAYKNYYTKLKALNDRVCQDLGLYYDAKMKLRKK